MGPPRPSKEHKKVRKVKKILGFDYFLDFSFLFGNFLGAPGSGVPNSSREIFLRLFGVSGFWVLLTSVDGRGDPKAWVEGLNLVVTSLPTFANSLRPGHRRRWWGLQLGGCGGRPPQSNLTPLLYDNVHLLMFLNQLEIDITLQLHYSN